jgi:hypothetical protein
MTAGHNRLETGVMGCRRWDRIVYTAMAISSPPQQAQL